MFKERTLPYDYGEDLGPSHNYASLSSSLTSVSALAAGYDTLGGMLEARAYGKDNAFTAYPNQSAYVSGYETFRSTTLRPPTFNNCTHVRLAGCDYPYSACFVGYKGRISLYNYMRTIPGAAWPTTEVVKHHSVDVSSAQRSAWAVMQPRFEGDVSMINFIIELKDFRSLARFLLNKPLRKLSNMFKRLKKKPKFDLTKPLSELHLANEFALKPLISDIISITCQMEELIADVQQDFADAGRERNSRHYSETFQVLEENTLSAYQQYRYPQSMTGYNEQFTFNATMEYSYEYNMRSTLDAFVKYWGLAPNATAIWNAIPGSFLVDYFYTVGKALEMNSRDRNVKLTQHQYCESYLSERSAGYHIKASKLIGPLLGQGTARYPGSVGNYLLHGTHASLFTRRKCYPNKGAVLPKIKMPSTKQGQNILALARCFF